MLVNVAKLLLSSENPSFIPLLQLKYSISYIIDRFVEISIILAVERVNCKHSHRIGADNDGRAGFLIAEESFLPIIPMQIIGKDRPAVFVVMTIYAEVFPVAAVRRVVIMVAVLVVDGKEVQVG